MLARKNSITHTKTTTTEIGSKSGWLHFFRRKAPIVDNFLNAKEKNKQEQGGGGLCTGKKRFSKVSKIIQTRGRTRMLSRHDTYLAATCNTVAPSLSRSIREHWVLRISQTKALSFPSVNKKERKKVRKKIDFDQKQSNWIFHLPKAAASCAGVEPILLRHWAEMPHFETGRCKKTGNIEFGNQSTQKNTHLMQIKDSHWCKMNWQSLRTQKAKNFGGTVTSCVVNTTGTKVVCNVCRMHQQRLHHLAVVKDGQGCN